MNTMMLLMQSWEQTDTTATRKREAASDRKKEKSATSEQTIQVKANESR